MNHYGQFKRFKSLLSEKNQRRVSKLINKISILPVITRAKYVFRYLSIYRSNSNLGKKKNTWQGENTQNWTVLVRKKTLWGRNTAEGKILGKGKYKQRKKFYAEENTEKFCSGGY